MCPGESIRVGPSTPRPASAVSPAPYPTETTEVERKPACRFSAPIRTSTVVGSCASPSSLSSTTCSSSASSTGRMVCGKSSALRVRLAVPASTTRSSGLSTRVSRTTEMLVVTTGRKCGGVDSGRSAMVAGASISRRPINRLLKVLRRSVTASSVSTTASSTTRCSTRPVSVISTSSSRVEQRVVELAVVLAEDAVTDLRNTFNSRLMGRRLIDAPATIADLPESTPPHLRPVVTTIISVVLETLVDKPEERVVLAGTANLTRSALDFPQTIRPVLEALEEQVVLLKLLGEAHDPTTVLVRIGAENRHAGLRSTSVVSVGYGAGDTALAGLGVLGPTRMDYPGTMAAVRAVARYVGELLAGA